MTWWIGRPCTTGNGRSAAVLRAEGAAPASSFGRATRWIAGAPCYAPQSKANRGGRQAPGGGAVRGVGPPVPFPNTVVKRPSADDTGGSAVGTIGRCRPLQRGVEQ